MLNIKVAWSFKYKKLHLPIKNPKIKLRILTLSFLSLTIVKRDVSSAKSLALDFNPSGRSLI